LVVLPDDRRAPAAVRCGGRAGGWYRRGPAAVVAGVRRPAGPAAAAGLVVGGAGGGGVVGRGEPAAPGLRAGGLASRPFALVDLVDPAAPPQYQLVRLHWPAWAVLLVLGVVAIVGAWLGRRLLVAAAGVGFGAAAVVQLVQLGGSTNWLHGDGSTMSLFLG